MAGDLTVYKQPRQTNLKSVAGTNATLLYRGKCILRGWAIFNHAAAGRFIKFYDMSRLPVVGTDTPVFTFIIAGAGTNDTNFNASLHAFVHGVPFYDGLAYAITTGIADTDTGACTLDDINGTLDWAPTR